MLLARIPKSRLFRGGIAAVALLMAYLAWDFFPPREIPLRPDTCWGLPCLRAKHLIIQELDRAGRMWATRGLWAYSRDADTAAFTRRYHIPTGAGLAWLNNFSVVRWLTGRENCVELVNLPDGGAAAQSGPHIWLRRGMAGSWKKTHTLEHYGLGIGRGLMPCGMTGLTNGSVLFGEYWRNRSRASVKLYRLGPQEANWQVAYTFPDHEIRHIHAVQADRYEAKAWVATGDGLAEAMVAWTENGGKTLQVAGRGDADSGQKWRACQLVFTPGSLYWGADTESSESGIYRYDRQSGSITNLAHVPGAIWYGTRLADGTIVMSSAAQGYPNEIDNLTRLWLLNTNDQVASIPCGAWVRPKLFNGYAWLRLPRNQDAKDLYLTCLNVTEFNGDLLVISPEALETRSAAARAEASR